jgi:hypothetical protein
VGRGSAENACKCLPENRAHGLKKGAEDGKMKRKRTMGSSTHPPRPSLSGVTAISATPACQQRSDDERDHQMEKLQFALAVAVSRGDAIRIQDLRNRIAEFGDGGAEPGT